MGIPCPSSSQVVLKVWSGSASLWNLIEIQILSPHPRPTESETTNVGSAFCGLTSSRIQHSGLWPLVLSTKTTVMKRLHCNVFSSRRTSLKFTQIILGFSFRGIFKYLFDTKLIVPCTKIEHFDEVHGHKLKCFPNVKQNSSNPLCVHVCVLT